jgi:cyanobactin maturation PatA/PatG family protease
VITGLRDLWSETLGDPSVCIAILDGCIDLDHPSLSGADIAQDERPISGTQPCVASQHGTSVASLIFGQHSGPVAGIAPKSRGLSIPIYRGEGPSFFRSSQVDLARNILQATESGANIINISGGQYSTSGKADYFLEQAIRECHYKDILVLAAAGNDGCQCLHVPGSLEAVLAVGAMDREGKPLDFSNWGYGLDGLLAPGEGLVAAKVGGGTLAVSGTSSATAIVSGIAALLMTLLRRCLQMGF